MANKTAKSRKKGKQQRFVLPTAVHRAVQIVLVALAIFIGVCFVLQNDTGFLGPAISGALLGLFSVGGYLIPAVLVVHAVFYMEDIKSWRIIARVVFSLLVVLSVSSIAHMATNWSVPTGELVFDPDLFYANGVLSVGGGSIGGAVAFGLLKTVGRAGLIILSGLVFVIYILFFFAKGSTLREIGRSIIYAVLAVLAFFEKHIKKLIAAMRKTKSEKEKEVGKASNAALSDDDFFDVDNGMESLEVPELGIVENRSRESIEENPTLHETVHHRSAAEHAERVRVSTAAYDEAVSADATAQGGYTVDEPESTGRTAYGDSREAYRDSVGTAYGNGAENQRGRERTSYGESRSSYGDTRRVPASDSADEVFTSAFDPYDIASNEELANKPSSRAAAERREEPTVTENIGSISEDDYRRMRREEEFERRKRAIVDSEREAARAKTVEFSIQDTTEHRRAVSEDETVSVTIDKFFDTEEKRTAAHEPDEKDIYETVYAPVGRDADEPRASGFVFEFDGAKETESEHITVERTMISGYERTDEIKRTPDISGAAYSTPTEISKSYGLDSIVSQPSAASEAPAEAEAAKEPEVYATEAYTDTREPLRGGYSETSADASYEFSLDRDDEENGEPIPEEIPEEEQAEPEEIPPEEQNPFIMEARGMFDIFREDRAEDNGEGEAPEEIPEVTDEDIDENDDTVEEDDVPFEEDDIPFKPEPQPISRPEPKPEPKRPEPKRSEPKKPDYSNYKLPPIELLAPGEIASDEGAAEEIREKSRTIIEKLAEFNVTATIKSVDRGPRITRYEVVPATGVKVAQVTSLYNDIKLALATGGVRMLAPVPGKSAVGFEVPNKKAVTVRLRELLENDAYKNATSTTFVCMGKDVSGKPIFADIEKFPHAVVAGATGTGKSVCINALLISILYRARPDEVKFILIDPKRVEFNMYNGIPHLLVPVVTEPKQAAGALMWACNEMEHRYTLIQGLNVRNIQAYNEKVKKDPSLGEFLPKIIIVIDELSNLMLEVKDPVEGLIDKIAAMARAAGIHLLLGTQRPDTNVISGKIKNNINVRISCKVTSLVDSRTVLDAPGAEKLLGKGDLLFKTEADPEPVRLQSCFVSDSEVEEIMEYLKQYSTDAQYNEDVIDEINRAAKKCGNQKNGGGADDADDEDSGSYYGDPEFIDAVEYCIRAGQASASNLQIKMKIGFQRASRYITQMEEIGVVSEKKGQKPRDVLITIDEWHEKLSRVEL